MLKRITHKKSIPKFNARNNSVYFKKRRVKSVNSPTFEQKSISSQVEDYLNNNPTIRETLLQGLINYSKLSRLIKKDLSLESTSLDTLIVSCRRYFFKNKEKATQLTEIKNLILKSTITVQDKVSVLIIDKLSLSQLISKLEELKKFRGNFNIVQSMNAITIVTEDKLLARFKKLFSSQLLKESSGVVKITIEAPIDIENVRGHNAYIFSLLANRGINIIEQMSCWTDTIIVIDSADTEKAIAAIRAK